MGATLDPGWNAVVRDPRRAALLIDFDGSLAPIVDDPARAAPLPLAVEAAAALARRLAVVGVVTGRPVEFVRGHVHDPAIVVVGQYGLEHEVAGVVTIDPRAVPFEPVVVAAAAEAEARWPSLLVERKGRVAFTVHWRTHPGAAPPLEDIDRLATAFGLAALPGRMACEVRPPIAVDKGTAVAAALADRDVGAAAFAGDDHGDLAAFAALSRWAAAADDRAALRIAVASPESPAALVNRADLRLDGPPALAAQLDALAQALTR